MPNLRRFLIRRWSGIQCRRRAWRLFILLDIKLQNGSFENKIMIGCNSNNEYCHLQAKIVRSERDGQFELVCMPVFNVCSYFRCWSKADNPWKVGVTVADSGDLAGRMASYVLSSKAENTNEKYSAHFNHFKLFCNSKGYPFKPADSIHVAIYLTHCWTTRHHSI